MISVAAAKQIIRDQTKPLTAITVKLSAAAGAVLAADVFATMDIPAFDQSSMDGYAFSFDGWKLHDRLKITGEVPAGSDESIHFTPEIAVRIFTGAPVPVGADTVVMQEKVNVVNGELHILDEVLAMGGNVRPKGSEIKKGELALAAGVVLTPAAIGFLAGIGATEVSIYPKPTVGIIVTGKELQQPGNALLHGQVYESNSATLAAALQQSYISNIKLYQSDDDLDLLTGTLNTALKENDLVLLTGGISVGDYDFVLAAAGKCGVSTLFHRVKQRPGKPLLFGKKDHQLVFGLPGNPSSVLTCFYEYVLAALQLLSGGTGDGLKTAMVPLEKGFEKTAVLTQFLKGRFTGEKVLILEAQESYRLSSFAKANCLVKIEEAVTHCREGETVEIHLLPE